jgi:gliding motility-associated-like protein
VFLTASTAGGVGMASLTWSPGNLSGSPVPALVGQSTQFVVSATDVCQNTATDTVYVQVPDAAPLNLTFSPDTVICPGESVLLQAQYGGGIGELVFIWDNGHPSDSLNQWVSPPTSQVFTVSVSDSCGNVLSQSARITVRVPQTQFEYHYIDNNKIIFDSESSLDVVDWLWEFAGSGTDTVEDPIRLFVDTGFQIVRLTVTNEFGCQLQVQDTIYIYPPFGFYIPNSFTPNNDLLNDIFRGYGQGFKDIVWRVFDRWGQEVFVSSHLKRGWDGQREGVPYPLGVYVYRFELVLPNNRPKVFMGNVNLIR